MTAIYRSDAFRGHQTGGHPENPRRMDGIEVELARGGLLDGRPNVNVRPATREELARVHDERYLDALERVVEAGGGWIDPDTYCGPDSLDVARLAAGCVIEAVERALDGTHRRAFVLGRPPGHHALRARAMGFCLLANVAIGAAAALARGLSRVAIVDWDVHHGNGTQDIFYESDRVLVLSMHRYGMGFFPGTGAASETGSGAGEGFTVNVPLGVGDGDIEAINAFESRFHPAIERFAPELILISAGFDAHARDPLGGLRMTERGFAQLAERVRSLAERFCDGRVVAVLEGGYDPPALGRSVAAVLRALDGAASGGYDGPSRAAPADPGAPIA